MRKTARLGLITAVALTIFLVEARLPTLAPIPGIKLGLSNIVTVFTVFTMGPGEGAAVLFCRIFLGAIFSGNFASILYSAAGGGLAILTTVALRRVLTKSQIWVAGCLGAVAHSVGQILMAMAVMGTPMVAAYLPVMIAVSIFTGLFTGLCAQLLRNRGEKLWKTIFR